MGSPGRRRSFRVAVVATAALGAAVVAGVGIASVPERIGGEATATERADRTTPSTLPTSSGPLTSPHPTLENLSVVWALSGPAPDTEVTVRYRESGATTWRVAMPLRSVPAGDNSGIGWEGRHAGTIFGLTPGTSYEIEATLADAGGTIERRTIAATTRSVPAAMATAPAIEVTPATLTAALADARPGDLIELTAGRYSGFQIERSGRPGQPIVIRGRPGAVVAGEIGVFEQSHVHVEDLTVDGRIRFNGSDHVAITGNTINADAALGGHGIVTFLRSEDAYIADNTVNGLTTWRESALGVDGDNLGEGILVTGPGHVIEHNLVRDMRDGISFLEDGDAVDQFSIDVSNNDVRNSADDAIEADFCSHDCRIIDNRVTNSFVAMSSQPSLGGPTYFVNNAIYNVAHVAFKLYRGSQGDVLVHNTVVKSGDAFGVYAGASVTHLFTRNNLFIGGPGSTYNGFSNGDGDVLALRDLDATTADLDHDGFGSTTGAFSGRFGPVTFDGLDELRDATTEQNAIEVTLDVFAEAVVFPIDAMTPFDPPDLRVDPNSVAGDVASPIADIGAVHLGAAPVRYGPR